MEDEDIEYDITFPSPTTNSSEIHGISEVKMEPVVILLGWLGCKEKHLAKYAQIYDQRGYMQNAPKSICCTRLKFGRNHQCYVPLILTAEENNDSDEFFNNRSCFPFLTDKFQSEIMYRGERKQRMNIV